MDYDLISIGGGSGGLSVAERAAEYGKKCLVIEDKIIGGTCTNVGCVPKKIMWLAANSATSIHNAAGFGFDASIHQFDFAKLKKNRDDYIEGITTWYDNHLKNLGIDYINGFGAMVDKNTVAVNGQVYKTKHIVIATGSVAYKSDIKGAEFGLNSDDFFTIDALPKKVAIIGSGYIAVEFAGVLQALGSEVVMFSRSHGILNGFDEVISNNVTKNYKKQGIKFYTSQNIIELTQNSVITDDDVFGNFDKIIWAIGRTPALANIGLEKIGVDVDAKGFVVVDKFQQTNITGVYAIGDITSHQIPLTPVAIAAGRRLSDRLFNNMPERHLDYDNIASVLFSHPPAATIGLTEAQAKQQLKDVKIYQSNFTPMSDALLFHQSTTALKLICQGVDEKIIGCHIFGHGSDEMMQGFAVAIKMGATKAQFDDTVAIHPTSSEELVTMR